MWEALEQAESSYTSLLQELNSEETLQDLEKFRELSKKCSELRELVETYQKWQEVDKEEQELQGLLEDPDAEIKSMASLELEQIHERKQLLEKELKDMLVPKDPLDQKDAILEIRAGTGGNEASLFAGDLLRMYLRYFEKQNWKKDILSGSPSETGGWKEIILEVNGKAVYGSLRNESGVHRVQRIPATESQGRLHTSAVTVAVLPQVEDFQLDLSPQDLRIDVFRASGPGGQSVNTTDSAVRITHIPTGIVAQSQDEKSQHKNKSKAMKVLQARIYEKMRMEKEAEEKNMRRTMVGSGDRSERIRTYNYPQGRVTDHRIGVSWHKLPAIMEGELEEVFSQLKTQLAPTPKPE